MARVDGTAQVDRTARVDGTAQVDRTARVDRTTQRDLSADAIPQPLIGDEHR